MYLRQAYQCEVDSHLLEKKETGEELGAHCEELRALKYTKVGNIILKNKYNIKRLSGYICI